MVFCEEVLCRVMSLARGMAIQFGKNCSKDSFNSSIKKYMEADSGEDVAQWKNSN